MQTAAPYNVNIQPFSCRQTSAFRTYTDDCLLSKSSPCIYLSCRIMQTNMDLSQYRMILYMQCGSYLQEFQRTCSPLLRRIDELGPLLLAADQPLAPARFEAARSHRCNG